MIYPLNGAGETLESELIAKLRAEAREFGLDSGMGGVLIVPSECLRISTLLYEATNILQVALQEKSEVMHVLAPNMPESGLIDACRQVKQATISEADNSKKTEAERGETHAPI